MSQTPPSIEEPGTTVRTVCNWVVGLLLVATLLHLLMLPSAPRGEDESEEADESAVVEGLVGARLTRVAETPAMTNPLDPNRAMGYLEAVCAIGPRISGTDGMKKQQALLVEHFEKLGAEVELQRFAYRHPLRRDQRVRLANLIVRWRPQATRRVLLCAHYDTRPLPDRDPDRNARKTGLFLGANDGGSGVAVLMELGHLMAARFDADAPDRSFGVDFVLFDAEELVYSDRDPYFLGSQWFATQYKQRKELPDPDGGPPRPWEYEAAVLLDMVGDADLQIFWEGHSFTSRQSRPIAREVWDVAERLGVGEFHQRVKHEVLDDHLALRRYGGIRAIDVIDFDYPFWHTRGDTPDKCSGESLAKVGWVMWEWIRLRAGAAAPL